MVAINSLHNWGYAPNDILNYYKNYDELWDLYTLPAVKQSRNNNKIVDRNRSGKLTVKTRSGAIKSV